MIKEKDLQPYLDKIERERQAEREHQEEMEAYASRQERRLQMTPTALLIYNAQYGNPWQKQNANIARLLTEFTEDYTVPESAGFEISLLVEAAKDCGVAKLLPEGINLNELSAELAEHIASLKDGSYLKYIEGDNYATAIVKIAMDRVNYYEQMLSLIQEEQRLEMIREQHRKMVEAFPF